MTEQHHLITGRHRPAGSAPRGAGLLMTATLSPPAAAVARHDPALRLGDYRDALLFYLGLPDQTIDRILFVDNSASDLQALVDAVRSVDHGKQVELISFWGNDHPPERGKAYGEFKLMDHALAHGTLFAPDDLVWKTTGRLKFLNLPQVAQAVQRRAPELACDLHNVPFVGSGRFATRQHMDLRVFAVRPRAYDAVLRGLWQRAPVGFDATDVYHTVVAARKSLQVLPRFPVQPQLQGVSGRHQRDYQSFSQRAKDGVRGISRRVAPWLWL